MTTGEHVAGTVDIRPEVNILGMLKNLNYKPWFALGEFVDNAVGAFLRSRGTKSLDDAQDAVVVSIQLNPESDQITIYDDATGIDLADFPRAFRAADVPPDRTGLSEFGMGMKSAATWFARRWSVETSVRGEPVKRVVTFDINRITSEQIHTLDIVESPAAADLHYTMVRLDGLHQFPVKRTVGKIKEHLTSIYRTFLRSGEVSLRFNGEYLSFNEVTALEASPAWAPESPRQTWKRNFAVDLGGGRSLRGFAGVRAEGKSYEAGFALLRRGRLIVGSGEETYRPPEIFKSGNSYEWQRLYGEIELEGFAVSHTKDGFLWGEVTEDDVVAALKSELTAPELDLLRQARDYRARAATALQRNAIARVLERGAAGLPDVVAAVEEEAATPRRNNRTIEAVHTAPSGRLADAPADSDVLVQEVLRESRIDAEIRGQRWEISLAAVVDTAATDWLEFKRSEDTTSIGSPIALSVIVNFGHPFLVQYRGKTTESIDVLLRFASATAIAVTTHEAVGANVPVTRLLERALRAMTDSTEVEEIA